jgi:hypothetical protein
VALVNVRQVEVVMLNRLRRLVRDQLVAELGELGCERAQPGGLVGLERQVVTQEVLVALRHGRDPQVGHPVHQVLVSVGGLRALQLRISG